MTSPASIEQLNVQIATLTQQLNTQRLNGAPAEQRPVLEREIAVEQAAAANAKERADLNTVAIALHRNDLISKTGSKPGDFDGLDTIAEIDKKAMEIMGGLLNDPVKLREFANLLDASTPTSSAEPHAPGADVAPTPGAGDPAPAPKDATAEILDRHKGKGSADMASFLADLRETPPQYVSTEGPNAGQIHAPPAGAPDRAPAAPETAAPAVAPASPTPNLAPAPSPVAPQT